MASPAEIPGLDRNADERGQRRWRAARAIPGRVGLSSRARTCSARPPGCDGRGQHHRGRFGEGQLDGRAQRPTGQVGGLGVGVGEAERADLPLREHRRLGEHGVVVHHHPGGHHHQPAAGQTVEAPRQHRHEGDRHGRDDCAGDPGPSGEQQRPGQHRGGHHHPGDDDHRQHRAGRAQGEASLVAVGRGLHEHPAHLAREHHDAGQQAEADRHTPEHRVGTLDERPPTHHGGDRHHEPRRRERGRARDRQRQQDRRPPDPQADRRSHLHRPGAVVESFSEHGDPHQQRQPHDAHGPHQRRSEGSPRLHRARFVQPRPCRPT